MQVYTCIVSICKRIVKRVYLSTLRRLIIKPEFVLPIFPLHSVIFGIIFCESY